MKRTYGLEIQKKQPNIQKKQTSLNQSSTSATQDIPSKNLSITKPSPRLQRAIEHERLNGMPLITSDPLETLETEEVMNSSLGSVGSDNFPPIQLATWNQNFKTLSTVQAESGRQATLNSYRLHARSECQRPPMLDSRTFDDETDRIENESAELEKILQNTTTDRLETEVQQQPQERRQTSTKPTVLLEKFIKNAKKSQHSMQFSDMKSDPKNESTDICNIYKKLNQSELPTESKENPSLTLFEAPLSSKRYSNRSHNQRSQETFEHGHETTASVSFNSTQTNLLLNQKPGSSLNRSGLLKKTSSTATAPTPKHMREKNKSSDKIIIKNKLMSENSTRLSANRSEASTHVLEPLDQNKQRFSGGYVPVKELISTSNTNVGQKSASTKSKSPLTRTSNQSQSQSQKQKEASKALPPSKRDSANPPSKNLDLRGRKNLSLSIMHDKSQQLNSRNHTRSNSRAESRAVTPSLPNTGLTVGKSNPGSALPTKNATSNPTPVDAKTSNNAQIAPKDEYLNFSFVRTLGFEPLQEEDIVKVVVPSNKSQFSYHPTYFKPISDNRMSQFLNCMATNR